MNGHKHTICFLFLTIGAPISFGAEYRVLPSALDVAPGEVANLLVEVETLPGDNVVGRGYFSFAIDLAVSGTAGARGDDISNIVINSSDFDDSQNASMGFADEAWYRGVAGVTTDLFAPTFGHNLGDLVSLFTFDLTVPASAQFGQTILITPSEGVLENLVVGTFENVAPQHFTATVLNVVPEPGAACLLMGLALLVSLPLERSRAGHIEFVSQ